MKLIIASKYISGYTLQVCYHLINNNIQYFLGLIERLDDDEKSSIWKQIKDLIVLHLRTKKRGYKGYDICDPMVDLVIFDVPKELLALGLLGDKNSSLKEVSQKDQ